MFYMKYYDGFIWIIASTVGYYILRLAGHTLRRKAVQRQTALVELAILGKPRKHDGKIKDTAVIAGGSIAGLLTARVCHDYFDRVIIVEPDEWLSSEEGWSTKPWTVMQKRSRIIQYHSLHGLQAMGFLILKTLFPRFEAECKAGDMNICPSDFRGSVWGLWSKTPHAEYDGNFPKTVFGSRPGFESMIRRLVLGGGSFPNIHTIIGTVISIKRDANNPAYIKSVSVRKSDNSIDSIDAALVVDCTGPAAAGLKWLKEAQFGVVDGSSNKGLSIDDLRITYDYKMRYSTLHFNIPTELGERLPIPGGWVNSGPIYCCFPDSRVENKVMYSFRVDGDRLQLCCGAWGDSELPKTLTGFQKFVESLKLSRPIPSWFLQLLDMLHEVEDSIDHNTIRIHPGAYVRYHNCRDLPANYIAVGDSTMCVNPVWGQGMTKTMFGVVSAGSILRSICDINDKAPLVLPKDFSTKYFDIHNAKTEHIWQGTKIADYGRQTTMPAPSETLNTGSFMRWYVRRLMILSFQDEEVGSVLWHCGMFLAPGIDYFQFRLLAKVLWDFIIQPGA